MNLENIKSEKKTVPVGDDFDFDFKPITSGLGFHHNKNPETKSVLTERTVVVSTLSENSRTVKKEVGNVYQNDLSLFYGQTEAGPLLREKELTSAKSFSLASRSERVLAYVIDLALLGSVLGIVMTVMARTISMDLLTAWSSYPEEITSLSLTLFTGFYLLYFSVFEMTDQSTLGKTLFRLSVISSNNERLPLGTLLVRSTMSLLNFISLGMFSYFDLQSKVTDSKVIREK